jgi:hypothetical protein
MNKLVNEELQSMKYLLGYQRGKVISEQANTPAVTKQDLIKQIQSVLNTRYGVEPKLDVDGKWGNLTQTAFESAIKTKSQTKPVERPAAPEKIQSRPVTPDSPAYAPQTPETIQRVPSAEPQTPNTLQQSPPPTTNTNQPTRADQRRERKDLRSQQKAERRDLKNQQRSQ